MGITLLSIGSLLAPLQRLMGWMRQALRGHDSSFQAGQAPTHCSPRAAHASWSAMPASGRIHARRPLRVVRVVEGCPAPFGAGRMVISGRMADVCAELDRLAALEAAAS